MENAWPLWALPFWTMGVPLIRAVIEKVRTPKHQADAGRDDHGAARSAPLARAAA